MTLIKQLPGLSSADWLKSPALKSVFSLLGSHDEVRVVGGAVRNALLGEAVGDIDLATVHSAEEITRRAESAGLKTVATGRGHGTVSLIVAHADRTHVFEVTPLRIDIETDGRHAVTAPTPSWKLDAQRRDFYINALYCDEDGTVYDPVDGFDDVLQRRVRFIGSASQRIEEDYLRILRFFRFSALYAKGVLEAQGLAACIAHKDGLSQLSAERIKNEMFKLVMAPFASVVIHRMVEVGVMDKILPGYVKPECFTNLVKIEQKMKFCTDALPRLAALAGGDAELMEIWRKNLKLPNKEMAFLADLGRHAGAFSPTLEEPAQKALLYRLGEKIYRQCAVVAWSLEGQSADVSVWKKIVMLPQRWQAPVFLPAGADILALGVKAGRQVGEVLSQLEQEWIEAGFVWDAKEQMAQLKTIVQARFKLTEE